MFVMSGRFASANIKDFGHWAFQKSTSCSQWEKNNFQKATRERKNTCIQHIKPKVETDQIWFHQHSVHWANMVRTGVKEGQKRERKKEGKENTELHFFKKMCSLRSEIKNSITKKMCCLSIQRKKGQLGLSVYIHVSEICKQ